MENVSFSLKKHVFVKNGFWQWFLQFWRKHRKKVITSRLSISQKFSNSAYFWKTLVSAWKSTFLWKMVFGSDFLQFWRKHRKKVITSRLSISQKFSNSAYFWKTFVSAWKRTFLWKMVFGSDLGSFGENIVKR